MPACGLYHLGGASGWRGRVQARAPLSPQLWGELPFDEGWFEVAPCCPPELWRNTRWANAVPYEVRLLGFNVVCKVRCKARTRHFVNADPYRLGAVPPAGNPPLGYPLLARLPSSLHPT